MLKGIKPEIVKARKPHIMLSGEPGTGKTYFALNWPAPYFIDTESGATREQYVRRLKEVDGVYFGPEQGSQDFQEITNQLRDLATTKHPYKTLIIDSFSKLYNLEAQAAEEREGNDSYASMRARTQADRTTRKMLLWLERLPLNVILTCHQKDKWQRHQKELVYVGSTFDGYKKMHYDLDLWLQARMIGLKRIAAVEKSRIEAFPMRTEINLDFETFKKLYGASVIDEVVVPIILATPDQVAEIKRIVELLKISEENLDKWLAKAQAVELDDLSKENATKFLEFLTKKLKGESK